MRETESFAFTRGLMEQSLARNLIQAPWRFDFLRAAWLLERYLAPSVVSGGRGPVAGEIFRFRPHIMMGFPATDVRRVSAIGETPDGLPVFRMDVTFLGLYGVASPLPLHYVVHVLRSAELEAGDVPGLEIEADAGDREPGAMARSAAAAASRSVGEIAEQQSDRSPVRDFLDILHHRIISFFYRASLKYRYDMSFGIPGRDDMTRYLLMLMGVSPDAEDRTLGVDRIRLLRYAGVLTQHPRSAITLEGLLSDYRRAQYPVSVRQHVGRWVALPQEDMNRTGLANSRLGEDLVAGEQVYDLSGSFSIEIGPVDWETYLELLPDQRSHLETRALVKLYCADPCAFTIEIKLLPGVVPETRLASEGDAGRLGLTSWVRTRDVPETSVIFSESSCAASRFNAEKGHASSDADVTTSQANGTGATDRVYMAAGSSRSVG